MSLLRKIKQSFVFQYLKHHPLQMFSAFFIVFSLLMVLFGPLLAPYPPTTADPTAQLLPPSSKYWFGTDINGMCVFSRTIAAFRTDLFIALSGALLSLILGAPLGTFAGYFDGRTGLFGRVSQVVLRIMDVIQAFPIFVLGLLLVAGFGPNSLNLIFLIAITNLPSNLRLARSEALWLREKSFVEAARAGGNSELRSSSRM
jgi:peptide/nickel transport system permease protein